MPVAVVVVAVVPLVVATVRALAKGWLAIGDNGLILMRTEDVATADHPLLGTWTSASLTAGRAINNPGPLWYDVLAPFVKVAGPSVGFAVGVMAANAAAIVGAAFAARRIGGDRAMTLVTMLSAGLAWTMGSELLFDAWQPHAMVLPFWLLLVLAWGVTSGDLVLLPWLVGVAGLVVQTHLSFVYVVAAVGAAALAAGLLWRPAPRAGLPPERASWRRPLIWSLVVAVAAWAQPLIDQVAGTGNLSALVRSSGSGSDQVGFELGTRFIASVVAYPPWWGRPAFTHTIRATGAIETESGFDVGEGDVVGLPAAIVGVFLVLALLAAVVVVGRRRGSRTTVAAGVVAAAAVLAALLSMGLMPIGVIGLSPHTMRWLWPISAFVLLAGLFALSGWRPAGRVAVPLAAAATAVLTALNLPTHAARLGPTADRAAIDTAAALVDELDGYDPDEPVLFDVSTLRFAEPYSGPVLAALARNGVDVVVDDEGMVRQLGERRRASGQETRRIVLLEGDAARTPPEGARPLALVQGVTSAELAELARLRPEVLDLAERDGLVLSDDGLAAAAGGRIPFSRTVLAPGDDPSALDANGWIAVLVADGHLDLTPDQREPFTRYSTLHGRSATATVGVFEIPGSD
jgi:hypothetical protein